MTKADLIHLISEKAEINRIKSEIVVNTVFESMAEELKLGQRVEVRGFGTFQVREHGAYTGRNPRNGKLIDVKEKRVAFFKPGKPLADRIKNAKNDLEN